MRKYLRKLDGRIVGSKYKHMYVYEKRNMITEENTYRPRQLFRTAGARWCHHATPGLLHRFHHIGALNP